MLKRRTRGTLAQELGKTIGGVLAVVVLIIGAAAVVRHASKHGAPKGSWLAKMLARKPRMLVIVALFEILLALTAFDLIFALTGGGPGTATTVLSYFIWSETFKMLSFGNGAALAVIIAAISPDSSIPPMSSCGGISSNLIPAAGLNGIVSSLLSIQ